MLTCSADALNNSDPFLIPWLLHIGTMLPPCSKHHGVSTDPKTNAMLIHIPDIVLLHICTTTDTVEKVVEGLDLLRLRPKNVRPIN